jgi:hypothetical protein
MKLKLLYIFIFCSFLNLRSQIFYAGTAFSGYTDVVPDTALDIITTCPNPNMGCRETFSLTMFGSTTPNIVIYSHYSTIGFGGQYRFFRVDVLDPDLSVRFGRTSTCCYGTVQVAKPLVFNDSINSITATWNSFGQDLINTGSNSSGSNTITDFVASNDQYIGIKYQTPTDLGYGWIRVNGINSNRLLIKDYSWTTFPLGINETKILNAAIYPNPFSDELFIDNSDHEKIQLFDCLSGEINIRTEISENRTRLLIDPELPKGIYYLKVSAKDGSFVKKLIRS